MIMRAEKHSTGQMFKPFEGELPTISGIKVMQPSKNTKQNKEINIKYKLYVEDWFYVWGYFVASELREPFPNVGAEHLEKE